MEKKTNIKQRKGSRETKFDPKFHIDLLDGDLEAQTNPAIGGFDVDKIL